ncbi:alanine--tRNA ligase [Candidatus Latescibacterota bacterium]
MTSNEIREKFLSYFEKNGHARVMSSPVIPWGDPTLMFSNAGMNQFKDLFLGREKRDYIRATTCQKCIRAGGKHNDLEEVGRTSRHGTFLEMLGNFSFGDYFKEDAIKFSWEFITREMKLDPADLLVSVYTTDDESYSIWRDKIKVPEKNILRFGNIEEGDDENFWSMGSTGPCGPCSEIFIDRGPEFGPDDPYADLGPDGDGSRFLELWNLVFMQFNRDESGTMEPLPKPSIDTGLGLERMAMVLQDKNNIFESDILGTLVKRVEEFTGKTYAEETGMPFRVVADHVRTLTFAIADGAIPSNEGRGYVLRRVLRRASRYLRELDVHKPMVYRLVSDVVDLMGDSYPEIAERADYISMVVKSEEERFLKTLDQGVDLFDRLVGEISKKGGREIKGDDAFKLYDTFGFPIDLTCIMAEEKSMTVDMDGFEKAMEIQRERAREASSFVTVDDSGEPWTQLGDGKDTGSEFVGYETDSVEAVPLRYRMAENEAVEIVFDKTPFYALSGGQVSDTGAVSFIDSDLTLSVTDVYDYPDSGRVHLCEVELGEFSPEAIKGSALLAINSEQRRATERNHSVTHLLQAGLRKVLGEHVRQSGSYVDPERLRFDFNHFSAMKPEEIEEVEEFVVRGIMDNSTVDISEKTLDEARALGAMSLFDEKYGETVRVVKMGDISLELCGGTHVSGTGNIGMFRIVSESSVAAGIRRIEGISGLNAYEKARQERTSIQAIGRSLNVPADSIIERIDGLSKKLRNAEKEIKRLKTEGAFGDSVNIGNVTAEVEGIPYISQLVEVGNPGELKSLSDSYRDKLGSGVIVLAANVGGKVSVVSSVTKDIIDNRSVRAGDIVRELAVKVDGSGGGKPHFAMAGGKNVDGINDLLDSVASTITQLANAKG